jgi:hypothetical protein
LSSYYLLFCLIYKIQLQRHFLRTFNGFSAVVRSGCTCYCLSSHFYGFALDSKFLGVITATFLSSSQINDDFHYHLYYLLQVNDFLSGAAPLNLTMRLGDHMMLIQLQLSTVNQISSSSSRHHHTSSRPARSAPSSSSSPHNYPAPHHPPHSSLHQQKVRLPLLSPGGLYPSTPIPPPPAYTHSPFSSAAPAAGLLSPPVAGGETALNEPPPAKKPKLDTRALAEASKNLTQTLKQLSSEVLITRPEAGTSSSAGASASASSSQQQQQPSLADPTPRPRREVRFVQKFLLAYENSP